MKRKDCLNYDVVKKENDRFEYFSFEIITVEDKFLDENNAFSLFVNGVLYIKILPFLFSKKVTRWVPKDEYNDNNELIEETVFDYNGLTVSGYYLPLEIRISNTDDIKTNTNTTFHGLAKTKAKQIIPYILNIKGE